MELQKTRAVGADFVARARREFDELLLPQKPRIQIFPARPKDIQIVCELGNREIPGGVGSFSSIFAVQDHNPDNIYMLWRDGIIVGAYAMLMLSAIGFERLLLGELDTKQPDLNCLTNPSTAPTAIYHWAVIAPGRAAEGFSHIGRLLSQPKYRNANYFARPMSKGGKRICKSLGFMPVASQTEGLYRYTRLVNRTQELPHAA